MNDSTPMATSHPPPQQRPAYPPPNVSYRSDYGQPNGRPSPVNAQSPQMMTYSSPSPQQPISPQFGQPAAKRPRLSPDAPSPFSGSPYPQTPFGQQVRSPAGGVSMNGNHQQPTRPGPMAPPQRPQDRDQADMQNGNRDWQSLGLNSQDHNRSTLSASGPSNGLYPIQTSSTITNNAAMVRPTSSGQDGRREQVPSIREVSAEEHQKRLEERADWEAARHSQNELWDMFLYGGSLNDRIRQISQREHQSDPQHGVLINTQKNGPAPIARVVGQEGANRVIDKGQAILDSNKGDRLAECLKLVSLATKARLTGLVSASSRLSMERREHSTGRIPIDWQDIAVAQTSAPGPTAMDGVDGSNTPNPLKRTIDQANSDLASQRSSSQAPENKSVAVFKKLMQEEKAMEEARRVKRAKRKAAADAVNQAAQTAAEEEAVANAGAETTKKGKKAASKTAAPAVDMAQHVNAAAQMAMSNLGGRKGKSYSWMTGGGSGASTPSRPGLASSVSTPKPVERPKPVSKEKGFGAWDEDKDPGIQVRDVLMILETDGKAPRAYARGYTMLDN